MDNKQFAQSALVGGIVGGLGTHIVQKTHNVRKLEQQYNHIQTQLRILRDIITEDLKPGKHQKRLLSKVNTMIES